MVQYLRIAELLCFQKHFPLSKLMEDTCILTPARSVMQDQCHKAPDTLPYTLMRE